MSQLPYPHREDLDEIGQATWDSVVNTRGDRVIDAEGHDPREVWSANYFGNVHVADNDTCFVALPTMRTASLKVWKAPFNRL